MATRYVRRIALTVLLAGSAAPVLAQSGTWLDRDLAGWNTTGAGVPAGASGLQRDAVRKRCFANVTSSPAVAAVAAAGWLPFLHQDLELKRGRIEVVAGTTDATAACEPLDFNLFVFVDGRFAGTLSPAPMTTNKDGAVGAVRITGDSSLTAEFVRYAPDDPECCPSRRIRVSYQVDEATEAVVKPLSVRDLR
jgi:hypothetical protein